MLTVLVIALACGIGRGLVTALRSWRDVPRSNEDLVFY